MRCRGRHCCGSWSVGAGVLRCIRRARPTTPRGRVIRALHHGPEPRAIRLRRPATSRVTSLGRRQSWALSVVLGTVKGGRCTPPKPKRSATLPPNLLRIQLVLEVVSRLELVLVGWKSVALTRYERRDAARGGGVRRCVFGHAEGLTCQVFKFIR